MTQEAETIGDTDRGAVIRRLELFHFEYDLVNVAAGTDHPGGSSKRRRMAVRLHTEDGSVGSYMGGPSDSFDQVIGCAEAVRGLNVFNRAGAYQRMRHRVRKQDGLGAGLIDIAMWDAAGRRLGASVAAMLGATKKSVPAYASTWFGGDSGGLSTPEGYADFAEECFDLGYRGFKMHGWHDGRPERDIRTIRELGRRVGGRMALMHDAHCTLATFADALAVGRACDEAGFAWLEDPYADGGLAAFAHKRLREMIATPILLGEQVRHLESMATLTLAGGTDIVRADPDLDFGITGAVKRAHFAEALGLDVEIHAPGPAQRHLVAALSNTTFYELAMVSPSRGTFSAPVYLGDYSDDLDAVGADGTFDVPSGPGLGVEYDWKTIEAHTFRRHVVG